MSIASAPANAVPERRKRHTLPFERAGLLIRHHSTPEITVRRRPKQELALARESDELPEWLPALVQRLKHLITLSSGWAGRGSRPIDPQVVMKALEVTFRVAPNGARYAPQVVPTFVGGVQLEWHQAGFDLEIEIMPTGETLVDYSTVDESDCWDGDFEDLQVKVTGVLRRSTAER